MISTAACSARRGRLKFGHLGGERLALRGVRDLLLPAGEADLALGGRGERLRSRRGGLRASRLRRRGGLPERLSLRRRRGLALGLRRLLRRRGDRERRRGERERRLDPPLWLPPPPPSNTRRAQPGNHLSTAVASKRQYMQIYCLLCL